MDTTRQSTYGSAFADVYDDWYSASDDLELVVDLLCHLAPQRILELGVGTGRVAIPLAERLGARERGSVVGIDESREMLERLALKDTRGVVRTVVGDMVDDQPAESFDMVFISYNTLFNLTDTDRQARCITHAASRLTLNGTLVIDACVIDETVEPEGYENEQRGEWAITTRTTFDAATAIVTGHIESKHVDGRNVLRPFRIRYSSPTEIDEMAAVAGLRLESRYSGWDESPFTDDSNRHISVYRLVR